MRSPFFVFFRTEWKWLSLALYFSNTLYFVKILKYFILIDSDNPKMSASKNYYNIPIFNLILFQSSIFTQPKLNFED